MSAARVAVGGASRELVSTAAVQARREGISCTTLFVKRNRKERGFRTCMAMELRMSLNLTRAAVRIRIPLRMPFTDHDPFGDARLALVLMLPCT